MLKVPKFDMREYQPSEQDLVNQKKARDEKFWADIAGGGLTALGGIAGGTIGGMATGGDPAGIAAGGSIGAGAGSAVGGAVKGGMYSDAAGKTEEGDLKAQRDMMRRQAIMEAIKAARGG